MPKKKLYNKGGIVYSTAPDFNFSEDNKPVESLPPNEQLLTIILDKKHHGGKTVSIIKGFSMNDDELEALAKGLKSHCGCGGSAKNNEVIIQGDQREKILHWMVKKGFTKTRKI
ncbi:MAG TPA: translation initiation factor [Hanamia sp.]|nr:translation initiation factor [Hanamia sp.]